MKNVPVLSTVNGQDPNETLKTFAKVQELSSDMTSATVLASGDFSHK